jgi:N-acetyl-gamma-glutamyl-phosphate reductase
MKKIFIDGSAGTTGLRIAERLKNRNDIEIIKLSEENRKDITFRKKALNEADIVFLCLPDDAAVQAVSLIENPNTVVIDASTAHRTNPDWTYGFPELSKSQAQQVKKAKRIANPGCHASGFIALVYPLIEKGIIDSSALLSCFSITGYSGGGKKMIAEYEAESIDSLYTAPRQYGLGQTHKHLPEMKKITGLEKEPVFVPVVGNFYSGMEVTVPLFKDEINKDFTIEDIKKAYAEKYTGPIVKYVEDFSENGFCSAVGLKDKDAMEISVCGNEERILLIARYDNLGKGASGAAVQCMNIALGYDETKGLEL